MGLSQQCLILLCFLEFTALRDWDAAGFNDQGFMELKV